MAWSLVAGDEGHGFTRKTNRDYHFWASVMFWHETLLRSSRDAKIVLGPWRAPISWKL